MCAKETKRERMTVKVKLTPRFDAEQVFEDEIRPLMEQIQKVALAHGLPFVLAVGYGHQPDRGFATASTVCSVEGRTGAELYVAARMLSNPDFAEHVLQMLGNSGIAPGLQATEPTPPARLM